MAALAVCSTGCDLGLAVVLGARAETPQEVQRRLQGSHVIDLRPRDDFVRGHLEGSLNVPLPSLNGYLARAGLPADRRVVLVCHAGIQASLAVPMARLHGLKQPVVLAGGFDRWKALGLPAATGEGTPLPSRAAEPPLLAISPLAQGVSAAAGTVIKPLYMLLALALLLYIRRARSAPMRLLKHGLGWFFVGEFLCAVNFFFHSPGLVYPVDLLHGVGMVVMSALIPWGLFRLLDDRVLHFGDPGKRCQAQVLCGRCWKREAVACGPHQVMSPLVAGLALVCFLPWSLDLLPFQFNTRVFGSTVEYGAPILNHLVELRLYPALGALAFIVTLALLQGGPASVRRAEPAFFTGLGFFGYSLLRCLLVSSFRQELWWSDLWEELTELFMVIAVGWLVVVLRHRLDLRPQEPPRAEPSG